MTQLASVRFGAQSAEEILAYLQTSAQDVSSTKITQGIAIAILDKKRPENSGTLKKFILAKCNVEITPHVFCVAVSFTALNGTGLGFVEESKFMLVPLKWHLRASAIINLVANPKAGLDDTARTAVHEEIAEIFRTKPEKGDDLLKLIQDRYKPQSSGSGEGEDEDKGGDGKDKVESAPVDALSDEYLKAIGFQAAECTDVAKLTRVAQLIDYIRANVLAAKLTELGVAEVPAIMPTAPAIEAPAGETPAPETAVQEIAA